MLKEVTIHFQDPCLSRYWISTHDTESLCGLNGDYIRLSSTDEMYDDKSAVKLVTCRFCKSNLRRIHYLPKNRLAML